MNVIDASIKLYEWYRENDSFSMEEDFCKVHTISDTPERDKAAYVCALKNLEKYEIVQSAEVPDIGKKTPNKEVWVLCRPLESVTQTVEIDYTLATMIANLINEFTKVIERRESYSDPSNITPESIRDLTFMIGFLLNKDLEDENKVD